MPYVEGETLRERIDREKQLPVEEAVRIGVAVAGALAYAHQHGIVHRDIKPGNVLMQAGQPMVGDFGIALAVASAGGARLTETGLSVGTPIQKALEKLPADRFTTAQDLAKALADPGFRHGVDAGRGGRGRLWNPLSVGAAAAAAVFAIVAAWTLLRPEPPAPVMRFSLRTETYQIPSEWMSISPDGTTLTVRNLLRMNGFTEEALGVSSFDEVWADILRDALREGPVVDIFGNDTMSARRVTVG